MATKTKTDAAVLLAMEGLQAQMAEMRSELKARDAKIEAQNAKISELAAEKKASEGARTNSYPIPAETQDLLEAAYQEMVEKGEDKRLVALVSAPNPTRAFPDQAGVGQIRIGVSPKTGNEYVMYSMWNQTYFRNDGSWTISSPNKAQRALDALKAKAEAKAALVKELVAEGWMPPSNS